MFCKCTECGAVHLEPEINAWRCPICGSQELTLADERDQAVTGGSTETRSTLRKGRKIHGNPIARFTSGGSIAKN